VLTVQGFWLVEFKAGPDLANGQSLLGKMGRAQAAAEREATRRRATGNRPVVGTGTRSEYGDAGAVNPKSRPVTPVIARPET
jgi:hypothetical protein